MSLDSLTNNSALSIYEVSVGGITTIVEMSLFSTLLVKLRLHTKKRRRESGKQPTTGSQSKTTPVPVATEKVHEWCEWMKLKFSQVSANRTTLRMIPNGEVHNLTNPIQATEKRSCELCEWSRSNVQVFLLKITVFLQTKEPVPQSQKMRATEPEPNSHIKRKGITKKGGTKQSNIIHIQGGEEDPKISFLFNYISENVINISQREDVEIRRWNCCSMFIDFAPQSYWRKYQSKWNVCFFVFLFAQIVANENRPHILYQSVKVSTPECH